MTYYKAVKLFLRFALATSFLSAVADRLGFWKTEISVWGNWQNFLDYTQLINPWLPKEIIPFIGAFATVLEVVFALCLLIGFKTEFIAKWSGMLLLLFALSMTFSTGIKGAFDYSVFSAATAAFALSLLKEKFWEVDSFLSKS